MSSKNSEYTYIDIFRNIVIYIWGYKYYFSLKKNCGNLHKVVKELAIELDPDG